MRLSGKVAIVSGAGSGMGAAVARLFAGEGASLLVGDIYREGGQETARPIAADGGQAQFIETDVTGEADWAQLVAAAEERPGGLDILVNNAGFSSSSFEDPFDRDGWDAIISVSARGVYPGTRAAIPAMLRRRGGASSTCRRSRALSAPTAATRPTRRRRAPSGS